MRLSRYFLVIVLLLACFQSQAGINYGHYNMRVMPDKAVIAKGTAHMMDSFMAAQPQLAVRQVRDGVQHRHTGHEQTADFYLLMFLCLVLGAIRFADSRYFALLWRAFWNPTLSNRQLKDQLLGAGVPNQLMNVFFTMAGGSYIYYVVRFFTPQRHGSLPPGLLILLLIIGVMVIYVLKYIAVRFSGWAFRVEEITEQYLFNVFLINKILAVALVPFIIVLAFGDPAWALPLVIVSFVMAGVLLVNRYIRSWQVFGSFFQYSKFHFFTYLCASELLPLAVLMKLLVRGLQFY